MSFTVADVIAEVREEVQDTALIADDYRYSDTFLLRKVDLALRSMCVERPDLFTTIEDMTCVAGTLQSAPAASVRLMDVLRNKDGAAVKEVNQETLDLMTPTWPAVAAGSVTNWMRYPRAPNSFYVYPPADAGDTLTIAYARSVPLSTTADVIPLQDVYKAAVVFGTVWLVEAIDAEHVESGRAAMFKDAFNGQLAAGTTARQLTDTQGAGMTAQK